MLSIIFIFYFPKGILCSYFSVVKISMIYIHILFCSFLPTSFICENISLSNGQSILHQCQILPSLTGTFFHNMYVSVLNSNTEIFFKTQHFHSENTCFSDYLFREWFSPHSQEVIQLILETRLTKILPQFYASLLECTLFPRVSVLQSSVQQIEFHLISPLI